MKLSNSALNKYIECPKSFRLHYRDKLRPIEEPSSLSFGGCVDKGFGAMLEKTGAPEDVFLSEWKKTTDKENTTYSKSDLDLELLSPEFIAANENDVRALSAESLKQKGLLMISALRAKVLPLITKLHSVQEPIVLENQDSSGDQFIGFSDLVAELEGHSGPIILDLKTSSVKYKLDSVKESQQLCIYVYELGPKYKTNKAGYIVLDKKIKKLRTKTCTVCGHSVLNSAMKTCDAGGKKRCGGEWSETVEFDVNVDIIVDEISPAKEEQIIGLIDETHQKIKNEEFEPNFESCYSKIYRRHCPYYKYCHEGVMDGLVKKE